MINKENPQFTFLSVCVRVCVWQLSIYECKSECVNFKELISTGRPTECDMQAHTHEVITEMSCSPKVVQGEPIVSANQQ